MGAKILLAMLSMLIWWGEVHVQGQSSSSSVIDFGAVGDGTTDDSKAFAKAWQFVCGGSGQSELIIPNGKTFLLKPLTFQGPCKSTNISVKILGQIVAPNNILAFSGYSRDNWLQFLSVDGLTVDGAGTGNIDGNGDVWWKTCLPGDRCPPRPTMVTFKHCNKLKLLNLNLTNSPRNFIMLRASDGVEVSHLQIHAPADSPNTDGIDIHGSTRVFIHDSAVGTGDDCIAISDRAHHVNISQFSCGPGHGISIGSLGDDTVEEVRVWNSSITGAMTGIRIKTWQGGNGFARNIFYENITITNASYPILIDQYYCPNRSCTLNETSAVKISNVHYTNIVGTSATEAAITFNCSQHFGCKNIQADQINLTSAVIGKQIYSQCINAHGESDSTIPKINCF